MGGFAVGMGVKLSSGASLTYNVQHTFDELYTPSQGWSASRITTVGTIVQVNHGLSVGDWAMFDAAVPFRGEYAVASVVDADSFTITVADTGVAAVVANTANMWKARVFNHEDLVAKTTSEDGNYAFPPRASRLNLSVYASGFAELTIIQAGA